MSKGEKLQHILEAINMPEAFGDWDTDNDLDVKGHYKKWKQILAEMMIMVSLQLVSNMALLIPFFITGNITFLPIYKFLSEEDADHINYEF